METELTKTHVFIQGKVQGVFYRSWMKSQAESLGLVGWAKNLEDGRVEAAIQGPKEAVEQMVEKCREGSRVSQVTHIDVLYEKPEDFVGFNIIS